MMPMKPWNPNSFSQMVLYSRPLIMVPSSKWNHIPSSPTVIFTNECRARDTHLSILITFRIVRTCKVLNTSEVSNSFNFFKDFILRVWGENVRIENWLVVFGVRLG